jgi:hypothetical protein
MNAGAIFSTSDPMHQLLQSGYQPPQTWSLHSHGALIDRGSVRDFVRLPSIAADARSCYTQPHHV